MNNRSSVWAKSIKTMDTSEPISLKKHTQDSIEVFCELRDKVMNKIPLWDEIEKAIRISLICHDFGKVSPAFQIKALNNKEYEPFDLSYDIPHSICSVFFINYEKLKDELGEAKANLALSAVAYHHWRENFIQLVQPKNPILMRFCYKLLNDKDWRDQILENLTNEMYEYSSYIQLRERLLGGISGGISFADYVKPPYQLYWFPQRLHIPEEGKKHWIFISGFTMRCDHFASYCEEEGKEYNNVEIDNITVEELKSKVLAKIRKSAKILSEDEGIIWQVSRLEDCLNKNIILVAPTGYGKTEFAFLWSNGEKTIYTLPLRSAVNQIFDRAEKIWGEHKTGLLHSDADVYLLEKGKDVEDSLRLYELAHQISFPVIISTGDQFFPYALRPPGYEKIYTIFSYSKLIVDEIQAYNPKAIAIITKLIEDIYYMGGKFLIMTATLPDMVKERILERVDQTAINLVNIYEEEKDTLSQIKKHRMELLEIDNDEEYLDEVIREASNGMRVLVILNTVKKAQEVYKALRKRTEENNAALKNRLWLLHSRFTLWDRKQKEVELLEREFKNPKPLGEIEGKILVATQVVEASLDIDADVLFTEIAPMDSLVQRMGRIFRRVGPQFRLKEEQGEKYIYFSPKGEEYSIDLNKPNVHILVYSKSLESGRGRVYEKDLLLITLKIIEDKSIDIEFIRDWLRQIRSKGNIERFLDNQKEIVLSEYDKYCLVNKLYKGLPEDSNYFKSFNKMLDILESGYMSDKKEEAQRIFREIYDVEILPENRLDEFVKDIKSFFDIYGENARFSVFKKEVLSKFIVSMSYSSIKASLSESDKVYYKLEEKSLFGEEEINKLKRWTSGIFILNVKYCSELGILSGESESSPD